MLGVKLKPKLKKYPTVYIAFAVESDLRQRDPSTQKMGLLLSRGDITETVQVPPDICNKIY